MIDFISIYILLFCTINISLIIYLIYVLYFKLKYKIIIKYFNKLLNKFYEYKNKIKNKIFNNDNYINFKQCEINRNNALNVILNYLDLNTYNLSIFALYRLLCIFFYQNNLLYPTCFEIQKIINNRIYKYSNISFSCITVNFLKKYCKNDNEYLFYPLYKNPLKHKFIYNI